MTTLRVMSEYILCFNNIFTHGFYSFLVCTHKILFLNKNEMTLTYGSWSNENKIFSKVFESSIARLFIVQKTIAHNKNIIKYLIKHTRTLFIFMKISH